MVSGNGDDEFPWHLGVFDAHCHPTDTLGSLQSLPSMRAKVVTVMATRAQDQELVANAADTYGVFTREANNLQMEWSAKQKVIPAFGWHPWFSHQMFDESELQTTRPLTTEQKMEHYQRVLTPKSDDIEFLLSLPDPQPFGHFLGQTRDYLSRYPLALVGEVGLDRSFRIPEAWLPGQVEERDSALTPGGREGRRLSPYRVGMEHQKKVLSAQLRLAGEMQRAVSIHGVAAHGILYETLAETWRGHKRHVPSKRELKKAEAASKTRADSPDGKSEHYEPANPPPYPPRVCLHSFSGPAETIKQYVALSVPCDVYFSFSTSINAWSEGGDGKVETAVKEVPDERLLVESDLHTAGEKMDSYLEDIVRKIVQVKGWQLEEGVRRLARNWEGFVFGKT